jgi:hypothetical protein
MSDFNSSLPVRTEAPGDVIAKIADATIPSQQLAVGADGSINVTDNGGSLTVDAIDLDIRDLSSAQDSVEVLQATHDNLNANANLQVGDVDVANGNPVPVSDAGGSLTVDAIDLDIRDLAAATDSVSAWLKDEAGNAFSSSNPLPVVMVESEGVEINNFNTVSAVAAAATSNHDYTVTALKTLMLTQIEASASGKMKMEVQVETGAATDVFNTRFVQFNSTAETNMTITLKEPIAVAAGVRVRVIRTNRDNQSMDVYSTICGHEV